MIPFSPPRIDDKTIQEVTDALRSGWITTGPKTKLLEKKVADFCGVKKAICLGSATAGMELMLRWLGVGPGDEVIIPAYTYCATANVVVHTGATPVMADSGDDFNIDVNQIEKLITDKTKAIIAVDFAGLPCDYDELNDLVRSPKIKERFSANSPVQEKLGRIMVMADAAHSFGGIYYGTKTGSLTDVTVFSFHAVKNFTTAEGGAICFNLPSQFDADEIYKAINTKSLHGQSKDALAKTKKGGWEYDVVEVGYKCNMTDIHAAIGLVEIERYEEETLERRKEIFDLYSNALSEFQWAEIPVFETDVKVSSYHLYPLRIKNVSRAQRDAIIEGIFNSNVSVNVHFKPLPMLTAYKERGFDITNYPKAKELFNTEISLPVYFDLSDEQVEQVIKAVVKSVKNVLEI